MDEITQDVQTDEVESSTTDEVQEQGEVTEVTPTEESGQDLNTGEIPQVDERGVPVQNIHAEFNRKYGELRDQFDTFTGALPSMLEEAVTKASTNTAGQQGQQYTKEELIRFKNKTDDADHRAWAELEIEKIRQTETRKSYEDFYKTERDKQRLQYEQQQSQREVQRLYPMMFNSDGTWNQSHNLTQRVANVYNSNNKFKNDGQGLLAASKIAFADYVMEQQPQMLKQNKQLKSKVKTLEKATMNEGGGVSNVPHGKSEIQILQERFANTGRTEDLQALLKAKFLANQG